MNNSWLTNASANRLKQSYVQGFVDLSGNAIIRNGSVNIKNGKLFLPQGDISMNGNIICSGAISLGNTSGSGSDYQMTVTGNARIKKSILVDNDVSVMSSLGVGKTSNDAYSLDVNGAARISSTINVDGTTTITNVSVTGPSTLTGSVGIGSGPTEADKLFVSGQSRVYGQALFDDSIAIGPNIKRNTDISGSTLLVKVPITSTAANDVILNVPTTLYTSTDGTITNKLMIDAKNHVIKPSTENNGVDNSVGWDLGATGMNSFNRVYSKTLEVSDNIGIGKSSDVGYAIDVSGSTRLSSSLEVAGATTIGAITDVTGTSQFGGGVGIGKTASATTALDISGNTIVNGSSHVIKSLIIGQTTPSTATLHVNASSNSSANSVVLETPNVVYMAASSSTPSQTNFLEIDTKTRTILPYAKNGDGDLLNSAVTGWNLGGPGANQLNSIHSRSINVSNDAIQLEDVDGHKVNVVFDPETGSVNYVVTPNSGPAFTVKGVQTQKISSGAGTIDPSLLEFNGLVFGGAFTTDAYDLTSTFTYNLGTTTYTGNGTSFTTSTGAQSLDSFVTGTNLTTLLALTPSGTSVVIKVGPTDGRSGSLEGIDVNGSLVSLAGKIISVMKTGASTSYWKLWNSENYINVAGNYLNYIELNNINTIVSGNYFVAKTAGSLVYNIDDPQYMNTSDLITVNGDLYLYIEASAGNSWRKIPVSLPQLGSIQTQNMANSAISTAKLADNSVTSNKVANTSIAGDKLADNSITTAKIADGNVTSVKLADGSISGSKLAAGAVGSTSMIADGIITGTNLAIGSVGASSLGSSAVTADKLAPGAVTIDKVADSSVGTSKIADAAVTNSKMALNTVALSNIVAGSITGNKISPFSITGNNFLDGTITAIKLAPGAITSALIDASSVTVDKIASGSIETPKLTDLAVTTGKLAASSVTAAKIASGAVTGDKLAADSINTANIVDGAITTAKLTNLVVTSDQIASVAITSGKIVDSAITDAKLNTGSVTVDKIISSSVTSVKIADDAVTTAKIADFAVGTGQIANDAITSAKLATGAVLSSNIGSLEVLTTKIADGAVTAAKIAEGAVNSSALGDSVVDTANIATGAVATTKITSGSISTVKIADAAITSTKITSNSVNASIIADGSITPNKLAPGFRLPFSAGGGGASIDPTSDISVNSAQLNGAEKINNSDLSAKVITGEFLKLTGSLDTFSGVDSTIGVTYGIKNTGTFVNSGQFVINSTNAPTLTLAGNTNASGHTIEFRTTSLTNAWGAANEWRWKLDTYNGNQSMVLQKGGTDTNIVSFNEVECCFSTPITSMLTNPLHFASGNANEKYSSGALTIRNIGGSGSSVSADVEMLNSAVLRFLVNRNATTSSLWTNVIQSDNDFELHTGMPVNAAVVPSNLTSNRRLHIGYAGEVGIGTSYVNGTTLTVAGDVNVTGDIAPLNYGHSESYRLSLTNTLVKSGTSSEMGVAYSGRVVMNSAGTITVSSSVLSKAIYVYRLINGSWESSPSSTITRTETNFGLLFCLSQDGLKIAASDGTTIWMYIWNSETSTWVLQTQTITNGTGIAYGTGFVKNLKLNFDGSRIAIISYSTAIISKVYIYDTVAGSLLVTMDPYTNSTVTMDMGRFASWSSTSTATGEWTRFRLEFSSDASTLVVGDSEASSGIGVFIIYDINYTNNTTTNRLFLGSSILNNSNCKLGRRFSINANGTVLIVAAKRFDIYAGHYLTDVEKYNASVMIFTRPLGSGTSGWILSKQIYDFNVPEFADGTIDATKMIHIGFGADICVSDDGTVIYISTVTETQAISGVGPTVPGRIARTTFSSGSWSTPTVVASGSSTTFFGYGLATNSNGSRLAVSEFKGTAASPHGGKLYMYTTNAVNSLNFNSNGAFVINTSLATSRASTDETIQTFTHSGGSENQTTHTFTLDQYAICDILIVGGGGGGSAGGGGGGGYIYLSDFILNSGTYTISVGNGGTGAIGTTNATQGFNSSLTGSVNYIAYGGGGGGGNWNVAPAHTAGLLGSYGGNGHNFQDAQTYYTYNYTSLQGNRGGRSLTNSGNSGGGGGGAGDVGGDSVAVPGLSFSPGVQYYRGGQGGHGLPNIITGSLVYYAGGGTGGANTDLSTDTSTQVAVFGGGGLGSRAPNGNGSNGTNGSGGGGGGGDMERTAGTRGGSGIVIIKTKRYTEQIVSSNAALSAAATGEVGIGTTPVTGTKLTVSGNATITGTLTTSSDDRLKDNESLLTDATNTILKLRPEIYDKKPDFTSTDPSTWQKESGLVAQDIWYGAPELRHLVKPENNTDIVEIPLAPEIQEDPDYTALGWGNTPASVNYTGLIPYLIKSIQELKAKLDALN
jgi:hypothetical protein